ncbi:MAG: glycosyltransferase family 39 protein [Sphingobium sp.]
MTALLRHAGWPALLAALAVAAVWAGWVGFMASDDGLYYYGALKWFTDPPAPGANHWATRFPVVLGFVGAIAMFGQSLLAFHVVSLFWYAVIVGVTAGLSWQLAGRRAGWIAAILTATLPVIATNASIVNCDLPETAFLVGGLWLLIGGRQTRSALLAGGSFGLAVLCRETAILALAGLAIPFLMRGPALRRRLLLVGIGIVLVLGAEMLFQYYVTGNSLHRYGIAANHDSHINRPANLEGNFLVHPAIDPLLVLLVNDDFGLLFWVGAAVLMLKPLPAAVVGNQKDALFLIGSMALASFIIVSLLYTKLVLNPRYFTLAAIAMLLVVAIWLSRQKDLTVIGVLALIVASNLLLLSATNRNPRWSSEALAMAARAHPREIIAGEADVVKRAEILLTMDGSRNVRIAPFPAAPLRFVHGVVGPADRVVARYDAPPTRIGLIVATLGLSPMIPQGLRGRMMSPSGTDFLVRTRPHG